MREGSELHYLCDNHSGDRLGAASHCRHSRGDLVKAMSSSHRPVLSDN